MGARQKLNQFYLVSSLIVATLFGAAMNSSLIFTIVVVGMMGSAYYCGDVRPGSRRR